MATSPAAVRFPIPEMSPVAGKSRVLWLTDARGRRVGVPTEKLAYVEVGEEHPDKRVGFSSL